MYLLNLALCQASMFSLQFAVCKTKKPKFIKKQEAKGLLSNLGIRMPLSKIPVLGDVLNAVP